MQHSKPGQKLTPQLKQSCDRIYNSDKVRYAGLIRFVWHQQKIGWTDEAIAQALDMAAPNIAQAHDYCRYISALMHKAKARATQQESDYHKSEVGQIANEFVEFLKARRAG